MEILDKIKILKQHNKLIITILLLAIILCVSLSVANSNTYAADEDQEGKVSLSLSPIGTEKLIIDGIEFNAKCWEFETNNIENTILWAHSVTTYKLNYEYEEGIGMGRYQFDESGAGYFCKKVDGADGRYRLYECLEFLPETLHIGLIEIYGEPYKKPSNFKVSYYVNNELYETAEINPNEQAQNLELTEPGYKISEWYSDEACTVLYDFSKPVTNDLNLYCKKEQKITVTITFYVDNEIYKEIECPYGCTLVYPKKNDVGGE